MTHVSWCEFLILPLDMLDPVLLKLSVLLIKEPDRVVRLLLHQVRHLAKYKQILSIPDHFNGDPRSYWNTATVEKAH